MNNDRDQSVIDYILQLDTASLTTQQEPSCMTNQVSQSLIPTTPLKTNNMTKSDLFEFYLGAEAGYALDSNNNNNNRLLQQTKRSAQVAAVDDDDDKSTVTTTPKRTRKTSSGEGAKALSGRLDFRPTMTDEVPESQLKAMSPRERRQLRNKISARNFRNRRKEYMSTLEEELDDCKTENSKLHSELSVMQEKISQLENENKQLRLELVLYEQGINPATKSSSNNNNSDQLQLYNNNTAVSLTSTSDNTTTSATLSSLELSPGTVHGFSSDSSASPPDLNILHDFTSALADPHQPFYFGQQQPPQPHQQQQTAMTSVWDFSSTDFNLHDMFLSHAMMPNWDVNRMLSKTNEQSSLQHTTIHGVNVMETFQRYPLLAPALMSIVIGHTMTLSTDELLTLNLPTNTTTTTTTTTNDKRNLKIWELLQPLAATTATVRRKSITAGTDGTNQEDQVDDTITSSTASSSSDNETIQKGEEEQRCVGATVVAAFQRYLKSYICASVCHYLEHCCRESTKQQQAVVIEEQHNDTSVTTTDSNEKENNVNDNQYTPERKNFSPLCKHFRRAKELFIPVA